MSNWAGRTRTPIDNASAKTGEQGQTTGNTKLVLQRANKPPNHQEQGAINLPAESFIVDESLVTFEQANQHVGWQYNAGRDIIINVQSRDALATELLKMQGQIRQGFERQVISQEVDTHMQQQLTAIVEQLQSNQPKVDAILEKLETSRAYLQEASVKLAQQIPQAQSESGFFRLVVEVAALVTIAFDLGATAAVVAGLFGLVVRSG